MRRTTLLGLLVAPTVVAGLAVVGATPGAGAAEPPEVWAEHLVTWAGSRVSFDVIDKGAGTLYDTQTATAPMRAAQLPSHWQDLATATDLTTVIVDATPGHVTCVRARRSGTDEAWSAPSCTVRGLDDSALTAHGPVATFRPHAAPRTRSTVIRPGGSLTLPRVPTGSRLAIRYFQPPVTGTVPHWGIAGQPEQAVTRSLDTEASRAVPIGGVGRVWSDPALSTMPVAGLAVLPSWLPTRSRVGVSDTLDQNVVQSWFTVSGTDVELASTTQLVVDQPYPRPDFTPQLQLARAPMTGPPPSWHSHPLDQTTSLIRFRIAPGQVLCARTRNLRSDAAVTRWSGACVVRPVDDAASRFRGHRRFARDPLSRDRRASVLGSGARLTIGGVTRGDLAGYVVLDDPTAERLQVSMGGLSQALVGEHTARESRLYPRGTLWWATARKTALASLGFSTFYGGHSERLSSVWIWPSWADAMAHS